ncbi:nucleotidyltransferase family protein [Dethiobacter alkaliphilus]|uniref:nucleotidyltransferase family protein n=1 Tax=Dethiobacter alkaliphilus TaxID=427926 RepID=UPI0022264915|nr:nucleotidyltransferase family protein [Dethiobacter alkaliphilus]MCW3489119.1 nucleotidyltransferase family protein [Dethiobacter alkaliphilus]
MFDVVVLAGTGKDTELTAQAGVNNKAFISINNQPMLGYVLEALKETPEIGRIAVVGPVADLTPFIEEYEILAVGQAGSIPENIRKGFEALQPRQHFLIVSADIPFLSVEAVTDFLAQCRPYNQDFYYPIVHRDDNEGRFPGVTRTYVTLRDGVFTGGNLFLVNPAGIAVALPRMERFLALRKSPLKLAGTLGPGFVLKLLLKKLTIAELEKRFSALFGLQGKAVISRFAEIGTDVDKPADLELAQRML